MMICISMLINMNILFFPGHPIYSKYNSQYVSKKQAQNITYRKNIRVDKICRPLVRRGVTVIVQTNLLFLSISNVKTGIGVVFKRIASWATHVGFWFSCLTGSKGIRAHPGVPIITILYIQEDDDFHHHQPLLFFGKGGLQRALVCFNLLEQRLQRC